MSYTPPYCRNCQSWLEAVDVGAPCPYCGSVEPSRESMEKDFLDELRSDRKLNRNPFGSYSPSKKFKKPNNKK